MIAQNPALIRRKWSPVRSARLVANAGWLFSNDYIWSYKTGLQRIMSLEKLIGGWIRLVLTYRCFEHLDITRVDLMYPHH